MHDVFACGVYPFKKERHAWVIAEFHGSIEMFMQVRKIESGLRED